MPNEKQNLPATFSSIFLLSISGALSVHFFNISIKDFPIANVPYHIYLPGLLYISTTIIIFVILKINLKPGNLLLYYFSMYAIYFIVFYTTLISGYAAFFVGIITTGLGALATFYLTDKYIIKISFNKKEILISGSFAFIINDIFFIILKLIETVHPVPEGIFINFGASFILWQMIVGLKLYYTIVKI